jgi:hypothetical protein
MVRILHILKGIQYFQTNNGVKTEVCVTKINVNTL